MQAIILAAGMGKRLKKLTKNNTKCMVRVNGTTLIERMLEQLDDLGLERIVLVVGYKGKELREFVAALAVQTPIEFVENPIYDQTNNIYSLYLARKFLRQSDTLLLESDLIFDDGILRELLDDRRPSLALVDKYAGWMDGTVVTLGEQDQILDFIPGKKMNFAQKAEYYKTVNIYKFSQHFSQHFYVPFLEAYCEALGRNEYYEQVLRVITLLDDPEIVAKRLPAGAKWYEIDDLQDLDIAESIFAQPGQRLQQIQRRFGGYWRYPQLLDFCYLVNPYYPSRRLLDELKASFELLATQYPSGQDVNRLLAAKYYGVDRTRILVGNGAAELINALMQVLTGRLGIICPTFAEYQNKYAGDVVTLDTSVVDYQYNAAFIQEFFERNPVETLVLINPDNPSGNYMGLEELKKVLDWAKARKVRLIVDESFGDFADEVNTLLDDEILTEYPNLVVIKSISKSHGVPGLRLGVMATADGVLLKAVEKRLSIWNINSFGEYYLQIAEKYRGDFLEGVAALRAERRRLTHGLQECGLKVYPSQANFLMVKLPDGFNATTLTEKLYQEHDILVKDLSAKVGLGTAYVRIAVRNRHDNERLLAALRGILK